MTIQKSISRLTYALALVAGLTLAQLQPTWAVLPPRPQVGQAAPLAQLQEPGGYIQLSVAANVNVYTEVEWRGLADDWYVVEGWRGDTQADHLTWFVGEADFRKGPFRWRIYERPSGRLLGTSQPFMLPAFRGDLVQIKLLA